MGNRIAVVRLAAVLIALSSSGEVVAQDRLTPESIEEDVRFLVRTIEETHPDPYSAFGGKVEFKRRVRELLEGIPTGGLDASGVHELLAPLLADLGNGHTRLSEPALRGDGSVIKALPIRFAIATDAIFVSRGTLGFESLVGHRLVAAQEVPVERLTALAETISPAENAYGSARTLAGAIRSTRYSLRLFKQRLDTIQLLLESPGGAKITRLVPYLDRAALNDAEWSNGSRVGFEAGDGPIWWRYLDSERVGYLRLHAIEGAEAFREAKGRQDLPGYVSRYYSRHFDREAPADLDSALAGIPCFTKSVADLLNTMRDEGGRHLIVDVRGNGGGWSTLMLPLYLLVFGADYLDHPFPDIWVDVASPQLMEMNGWTGEDLAAVWGPGYEVGDYRFRVTGSPRGDRDLAEYADDLRAAGCGLAEAVEHLGGEPLYKPTVVVLVDTGTFSAAYQAAYVLWRLGAILVGVPSAQAGNAYTNVVRMELPNSGLVGSVARSAQIFFPDDDSLGRVLEPDFPMSWSDFARYDFDSNSELLYALELIAGGRIAQRGPRTSGNLKEDVRR